ncbi:general secretion pathway protein GspB [Pontibacterium sp.]|uniref:general secretion pathway protein GspB n=1 Tax=Pontibacterium sp. TaxID=2036026 RepID=UPI0035686D86
MSYILDALKHSDHDRNRGRIPDIQTQTLSLPETPSNKSTSYLWAGAVFLGIVIALTGGTVLLSKFSALPVQQDSPETAMGTKDFSDNKTVTVKLPIDAKDPPLRNDDWLLSAEVLSDVENVRIRTASARASDMSVAPTRYADNIKRQKTASLTKKPQAIQKPAAKTTAKVVQQPVPVASLTPPIAKEVLPSRPDPYAGIPHQKQLPSTFQKALPDLTFSVHIFSSKPASRMVKINGQRLREGDPIAAGLTLKQITQDGVILSYKNRQFWINAR